MDPEIAELLAKANGFTPMQVVVRPDPRVHALRSLAQRITYKPNVELIIYDSHPGAGALPYSGPVVAVKYTTLDSTGRIARSDPFWVEHRFDVPDTMWHGWADERQQVNLIFEFIRRVEVHEAREFFKVDGELVDDPHRGDGIGHLYR